MSRLGNEDGVGRDLSRPDSTVSGGDFGVTGGTTEHAVLLSTLGGTVCGSKVGDKGKFCIKLRGLCNVESHKAMERKDGVYLLAGSDKCWEKGGELGDAPLSVWMGVNNVLYRDLSRECNSQLSYCLYVRMYRDYTNTRLAKPSLIVIDISALRMPLWTLPHTSSLTRGTSKTLSISYYVGTSKILVRQQPVTVVLTPATTC